MGQSVIGLAFGREFSGGSRKKTLHALEKLVGIFRGSRELKVPMGNFGPPLLGSSGREIDPFCSRVEEGAAIDHIGWRAMP